MPDTLTNASGWWTEYPFNATNLSPVCDMVADGGHDFAIFGKDAYIIGFGAILTLIVTALCTHFWEPKNFLLTRENLGKILDNTILLGALMVAFALTMPTGIDHDSLKAADARAASVHVNGTPCPTYKGASWPPNSKPPSEEFLRMTMSSVLYLATSVLWSWISLTGIAIVGDVDDDLLTKVFMPQIPYLAFLMFWGIVQFIFAFLWFMNLIMPSYINRMFLNLWGIGAVFFALFPSVIMGVTSAKRKKRTSENLIQMTGGQIKGALPESPPEQEMTQRKPVHGEI